MSSLNSTRQPSASCSRNGSSGSNSNLRKANGPEKEKPGTRLTKARTRWINDFRKKANSLSKVGSLLWGNDLYIYFLKKGDKVINRKDITRWIMKYKWITDPIRGISSPRETRKLADASGGGENNKFAKNKKTDSPIKKGLVIKTVSYKQNKLNATLKDRKVEDLKEKMRRDQCIKRMQHLFLGLSKLEEFNRWLKTEPGLKNCLADTTKIFQCIDGEVQKYFRRERSDVIQNSKVQCKMCIKQKEMIKDEAPPISLA